MKQKFFMLVLGMLLSVSGIMAQMSKTVNVTTPGDLSTLLGDDKIKVTNLILTGSINAQDFRTIKAMSALKVLDMSAVTTEGNALPNQAFQGRVMDEIVLPKGLKGIGSFCFNQTQLSSTLILPSGLEIIGEKAFLDSQMSIDFFNSKNSLTTLGRSFLWGVKNIPVLDFSEFIHLRDFQGGGNFGTFTGYTGHVILPHNLEVLPTYTFYQFQGTVVLPEGLKTIGSESFKEAQMEEIILPGSLKEIGSFCFNQTQLSSTLILPSGLEIIGEKAFLDSQMSIDFLNSKNSLTTLGRSFLWGVKNIPVLDFSEFIHLKDFQGGGNFGTFTGYTGHVILPHNLEVLPTYTFYQFQGTVVLPEGLKTIGSESFKEAQMEEIILPGSLKEIGSFCFNQTQLSSTLVLPSGLEIIGEKAFLDSQMSIDFLNSKNSLTTLGRSFLWGVKNIPVLDFSEFIHLKDFQGGGNFGTFTGYTGHVILPHNLEVLPTYTFYQFQGTVTLSLALKTISNNAFQNSTIKEIELPATLQKIDNNAFYNCIALETIISNNPTPPALGSNVFYGVDKNTCKLIVPDASVTLYGTTNQWKDFLNVKSSLPQEVSLYYTEDSGASTLAEYRGIRIGEYYWMDTPFQGDHIARGVYETDLVNWRNNYAKSMTVENVNLVHYRLLMFENARNVSERSSYFDQFMQGASDAEKMKDFEKHYGTYLSRNHIDWMYWHGFAADTRVRLLEGEDRAYTKWNLPSPSSVRQLMAMCGNGTMHEVRQYLSYSKDQSDAPEIAKIPSHSYFEWFNPIPGNFKENSNGFDASNSNRYGFKMYPTGSKFNGNSTYRPLTYADGYEYFSSKGEEFPFQAKTGDFAGLNQQFTMPLGGDQTFILHDYPEVRSGKSWHWNPIRWARALTDEELGYKLYINVPGFGDNRASLETLQNRIDAGETIIIEKKGLEESPTNGFVELPRGYLRGFYVQYILNKAVAEKSIEEIIKISLKEIFIWGTHNPEQLEPQSIETRALVTPVSNVSSTQILYPNPVESILYINSEDPINSVEIYSLTGSLVRKIVSFDGSIDVNSLSAGSYIVKVRTASSVTTHKMLKK